MYALVMMLMLCTVPWSGTIARRSMAYAHVNPKEALSFDYSLFTMTRYAEERKHGATMEEAIDAWQTGPAEDHA